MQWTYYVQYMSLSFWIELLKKIVFHDILVDWDTPVDDGNKPVMLLSLFWGSSPSCWISIIGMRCDTRKTPLYIQHSSAQALFTSGCFVVMPCHLHCVLLPFQQNIHIKTLADDMVRCWVLLWHVHFFFLVIILHHIGLNWNKQMDQTCIRSKQRSIVF